MADTARDETLNRQLDQAIRQQYDIVARCYTALVEAQGAEEMLRRAVYRSAKRAGKTALNYLEGLVAYTPDIDQVAAQLGHAAFVTARRQIEYDDASVASYQIIHGMLNGRTIVARATAHNQRGFGLNDGTHMHYGQPQILGVQGRYHGSTMTGEGTILVDVFNVDVVEVPLFRGTSAVPLATIEIAPDHYE